MRCPSCLSIMKCISEIHNIPGQPGRQRMDLHCYNRSHPREPNRCKARTYMGVITEDPKIWECSYYGFDFKYNNQIYSLASVPGSTTLTTGVKVNLNSKDIFGESITVGYSFIDSNTLANLPYFIPLSTGDDMHEEAWKLFHKLKNLAIYS